jgi:hypothetical protein
MYNRVETLRVATVPSSQRTRLQIPPNLLDHYLTYGVPVISERLLDIPLEDLDFLPDHQA